MGILVGLVLIALAVAVMARTYFGDRDDRPAPGRTASAGPSAPSDFSEIAERPSLKLWSARGIDPDEADRWIARGFDADHAYLLISMGVEPHTAGQLRDAGLDDNALLTLVEETSFGHRSGTDDLVTLAERAPHLAPQFVDWISRGADSERALRYAEAGLSPSGSDHWIDAGWDLDEALPWCRARFEPMTARAWCDNGFGPEAARLWRADHFGVKQASQWRRLGDTPAQARAVEQRLADARTTVADALTWLDHGFTLEEICAGRPAMEAEVDRPSPRAKRRHLPTPTNEIKEWHAHFGRAEAADWIDVGVRDPAMARRLRERGLGPSDVDQVANRLAGVFDAVPVTRDDLLSAAGQVARAGGSPELRDRLEAAATASLPSHGTEASVELIEAALDELRSLDAAGALGAPHAARALARRLEEGLIVSALMTGRQQHRRMERATS